MAKRKNLSPDLVAAAQQMALMRLQLYLTGETHRLVHSVFTEIESVLYRETGKKGELDGLGLYRATQAAEAVWKERFGQWKKLFEKLQRQAAAIPFGGMAAYHNGIVVGGQRSEVRGQSSEVRESTPSGLRPPPRFAAQMEEERATPIDGVFEPQLDAILQVVSQRVEGDGLRLSERIWRVDTESLSGIKRVLANGVAGKKSAWDIAQELEQYLGAGAGCPRWTRARLNRMTKSEIADGDMTGLLRGDECRERGVSYNALRLARNELQIVHHAANDEVMGRMPWIEKERIVMSAEHPEEDECDDVVNAGEGGDGVYPKGTIVLPLHPGCLCWKESVRMDDADFTSRLRGWMRGEERWEAMDQYAATIGWDGQGAAPVLRGAIVSVLDNWLSHTVEQLGDDLEDA